MENERHEPPRIIQGGMGVGVSGWQLARAVARAGQLGVVSGAGLEHVFARRLQLGDPGGAMRRAVAAFPVPAVAARVLANYYVPGEKPPRQPFRPVPMFTLDPTEALVELTVLANFAEVFLAKEGHGGLVGINYLHKIQLAMVASLYGAILAGVDYVIVGAGNPHQIPALLTRLAPARASARARPPRPRAQVLGRSTFSRSSFAIFPTSAFTVWMIS